MRKLNKNIRNRAKIAVQKLKKGNEITDSLIDEVNKNEMLHKTITPKKIGKKKDKLKRKHKNLMNKFVTMAAKRKEENARKNREKTAVVGDLKPLKDALPSLDELFKMTKAKGNIKTGVKEFDEEPQKLNPKQKFRQKQNKLISQANSYQALLKHPDFKKNPREAIAFHIKYTHGLLDL
ncbi:protein FAM207A [Teleopsis dalmanni]|uniref:protein FAM207A n=1 Tax=Teleopsis dalmanni TaxID=139649 RepID=UPI0018CDBF70|nr:protein FAM207A [Teleopsis dalmanni]